jgi:hypothetical protein
MSNLPVKGPLGPGSHGTPGGYFVHRPEDHAVSGGMVKIAYQDYLNKIKGEGLHLRDLLHEGKLVTYRFTFKDYKLEPIDDLTLRLIPELTVTRENEEITVNADIRWIEREALKKLAARLENNCGFKIKGIEVKEEANQPFLVLHLYEFEI